MRTLLEGDQISTPEESVGIKRRKFVRSQTQGGGRQGMSGVTLIEILIIIAILGVLAAVVIPNLSRLLGQ